MESGISADEFFLHSGSEQLEKIYGWARHRYGSPWGVFFGVLLRVAASVPPHVQLPPVVGRYASLNMLCAFVGESGRGKGNTTGIAREAWPTEVLELPVGSGQGIAAEFANNPGKAVIFDIPEIDALRGNAAQQGSIVLATIKSFAMGELLGQANATKDARRIVSAHSYRGCLSVGAQPGHADVIFGDASGGLPQRFLWAPVVDPNHPGGKFPAPDPLVMDMPDWGTGNDGVVEVVYGHPKIEPSIVATHIANVRGEGDPLDGHANLTRCKVAALLAIMHGRLEVTEWDWNLSATVMVVSNATRAGLERDEAEIKRRRFQERGLERAIEKDGFDAGRLESVIRSIVEQLHRSGEMPGSELRTGLTSDNRRWFDQAIAKLAQDGRIVAMKAGSGFRYRLTDNRQGGDRRQGVLTQVRRDGDARQGGTLDNVVSMENRRSQTEDQPKISCLKWMRGQLAELHADGQDTVEALAVRAAGEAEGYNKNQLYVAANTLRKGPDGWRFRGATWSLNGFDSFEREGSLAVRGGVSRSSGDTPQGGHDASGAAS